MYELKQTTVDKTLLEQKWDKIYQQNTQALPALVLTENQYLLPTSGCVLDLACGLGENALVLAEHDLVTHAWDISSVALHSLKKKSQEKGLNISVKKVLIEPFCLPKNTFDVIVLTRFLDRSLCNEIMESLKVDGLLFYQTFVREKTDPVGPNNPDFLLARNELLTLFSPLKTVFYKEDSLVGNLQKGERNEVFFVGQKC